METAGFATIYLSAHAAQGEQMAVLEEGQELFDGYCMKCRVKVKNLRGRYRLTPNNRGIVEGHHTKCGTKVVKITKVRAEAPKKKKVQA
jgi:hypothetical protein